jgi:hypothetical protein
VGVCAEIDEPAARRWFDHVDGMLQRGTYFHPDTIASQILDEFKDRPGFNERVKVTYK